MKRLKWTQEEVVFIKRNKKLTDKELSSRFNRSISSIKNKKRRLGLIRAEDRKWKNKYLIEIYKIFSKKYPTISIKEMSKKIGCPIKKIYYIRGKLGINRDYYRRYSFNEIEFIKNNLNLGDKEISKRLNRSRQAINLKRQKLGIKLKREFDFTEEELEILKKEFPRKRTIDVAKSLGRRIGTIRLKARKLGLEKNLFSKEEVINIISLYNKGYSLDAIGNLYKRTRVPIARICRKNKIKIRESKYRTSKIKCDDGHIANSSFEAFVDNWLFHNRIVHKIQVKLCQNRHWTCDFVVGDWWIEADGLMDKRNKVGKLHLLKKIDFFNENHFKYLIIYPKDDLNKKLGFLIKEYSTEQKILKIEEIKEE